MVFGLQPRLSEKQPTRLDNDAERATYYAKTHENIHQNN
jgi:hypothetical protein